jgi:TolB-like protein/DNA-binding SARP family transcriptional activator
MLGAYKHFMPQEFAERTADEGPRLAVLGTFELRRGDRLQRLPKKAQGLLAFLAVHEGQAVSRDQLSTLLWGNTATEQARQSLRQALVAVRGVLGTVAGELIVADTDSVILKPNSGFASSDLAEFHSCCRSSDAGELERAAALWRGELLTGLHIPVEPFNDWLSPERQRLGTMRAELLLRVADARASAGDLPGAIAAVRDLTAHDPLREEGHRLLMRLLARAGQRSAALKQYERLANLMSDQLGVSPDADTAALAAEIRDGGPAAARAKPQAMRPPTALSQPQPVMLSASEGSAREATAGPALPDKPSIVVLPFTNLSGDAGHDIFIDGLVDDITIALGREKWLFVIATPSAFAFRDRNSDPREVAAKLGVRYVLRGSVRISGNRVRIVVMLTDAASSEFIWSDRFEDDTANIFELNDRLMSRVAAAIAPALRTVEIERAQRKTPANLSSFECYLRAVPKVRKSMSENLQALKLLEQAIALDPNYSAAYALSARCYQFQRLMGWVRLDGIEVERGAGFARLAVELGRSDSEALWMAAHAICNLVGENDHAREMIERSLSLNPNSASAWSSSCHILTVLGEFDKAIEHADTSQRLNPADQLHHIHWNIVGLAHFGAQRYADADACADKALRVQPAYPHALRLKVATCGALGRPKEGRAYVQRLLAVHPECSAAWVEQFWRPMMIERTPGLLEDFVANVMKAGLPASKASAID